MLVHPSAIDLSSRTLRYLSRQLSVRRGEVGMRWRRLSTGRQALLAPAHVPCGDTYTHWPPGSASGPPPPTATYARPLSCSPLTLTEAMEITRCKAFAILDGILLPIDRIAADRPYYSPSAASSGFLRPCQAPPTT